ncbi:hypothetical protein AGABI1DRAFT_132770 [Agaricus bisporus var. burnettii JB137-S8]|uniref:Uncharacterized protein n=1 Tax=Agaricus bisporus var. burnettii (strain JB137-S8 / ATCC MYA-4627 / FGSC 10392) TaxID=597362 RepID=K5WWF6_AGABU|nr:uncharacterized protein AGABI1DRAFT_132770 [Agaricus bisporus var. burnettii JB137-S8]EKM74927.1 hypothetical protein AGABI1DRAFT_132770 [Agaricus bisporus var. burnettii JB137-S8]
MPPLSHYLRSSEIICPENPAYDAAGRQLPFQESPQQRRERIAFVHSLRCGITWTKVERHSHTSTPSTSSSESSSPRTPGSPLNTPHTHTHTPQQHKQQRQDLDTQLAKLALSTANVGPPRNRQRRNYKNLHLPSANTTSIKSSNTPQQPHTSSARGIFDSSSYTYPSASPYSSRTDDDDQLLGSDEPYILYSSTLPKRPLSAPPVVDNSAGIGGFPCPPPPRFQTSPMTSSLPPSSSSLPTLAISSCRPTAA